MTGLFTDDILETASSFKVTLKYLDSVIFGTFNLF